MIFFETSNYDNKADFGKWSFFVKPKWFHGGFRFFNLKPPSPQGGFKQFWRFFFLDKVSWPKNAQNLAQIHHMLGFYIKPIQKYVPPFYKGIMNFCGVSRNEVIAVS